MVGDDHHIQGDLERPQSFEMLGYGTADGLYRLVYGNFPPLSVDYSPGVFLMNVSYLLQLF